MSDLTELEIFDCLLTNFREAAERCEELAQQKNRIAGQRYVRLRENLMRIEGACRQAAVWREDARWFLFGQYAAECHKRCGGWLRHRDPPRYFLKLADNMLMMLKGTQELRDRATGKRGMILDPLPDYRPDNRTVQVPRGGILLQ